MAAPRNAASWVALNVRIAPEVRALVEQYADAHGISLAGAAEELLRAGWEAVRASGRRPS